MIPVLCFLYRVAVRDPSWKTLSRIAAIFFAGLALVFESRADTGADGTTPLMLASASGEVGRVEELIGNGAGVDESDAHGHTAIWHAVNARKADVLAVLLKKAGTPEGRCPLGRGAIERAFELDDWNLIQPILAASRTNLGWTRTARNSLIKAITGRTADHVKAIVASHWLPPKMDGSRHPLLAHTILRGDAETTAFLLDCGLDPNTRIGSPADPEFTDRVPQKFIRYYLKNDRGVTLLMLASGMENLAIVKLLLERGAREAFCTYRYKMGAMSFAAEANHHDIMRALIGPCPQPSELRVEISLSSQRATLFKNEKAVESTPISTGVQGKATKPGNYIVTNKEPLHASSIYKGAKMPFFMRLNCGDFGMHQGAVTGSPASHGCVRLPAAIARKWYARLPAGTEVSIY